MRAIGTIVGGTVVVFGCLAGADGSQGSVSRAAGPVPDTMAATSVAADPPDSDAAHAHAHRRDYQSVWDVATPVEQAAATRLVEETRAATAKYADVGVALAAGYRPNLPRDPTHYPKPSLMRDGKVLDPDAPESLMYWTAPDGRIVLVAAVYKAAASEVAPAPGGDLTVWHTHLGDAMCHPAQDAACPQHTMKMLHVFVFDGVRDPFAESLLAAAGRGS